MSVTDLDLVDWKTVAEEYKGKNHDLCYKFIMPLSVVKNGITDGKFIMNSGHKYVPVYARETNLRLGSPIHRLVVEQKFYEWVKSNRAPKMQKPKPIGAPEQCSLL